MRPLVLTLWTRLQWIPLVKTGLIALFLECHVETYVDQCIVKLPFNRKLAREDVAKTGQVDCGLSNQC